jgi:hypothetical protein
MKDEGGRMKGRGSLFFILHPSAFILGFACSALSICGSKRFSSPGAAKDKH